MIKAEMPERGMWEIEGDEIKDTVCEVCADLMQKLSDLQPVKPQPKTGHWIGDEAYPICSKCNCNIIEEYISCSDYAEMDKPMKFCPNCGAKMVKRSEKE